MNYDIELYSIIIPVVLEIIITCAYMCISGCMIVSFFFLAPEKPEKR